MFTVHGNFLETEITAWAPQRGSVFIPTEQEGEDLLRLVPGRQCTELFMKEKLKVGTIRSYKSAIMMLTNNAEEIARNPMFSELLKTLDEALIRSFVRPTIDISPILRQFREWGPIKNLSIKQLTSKLCWFLAVTGFLRTSDIHRIYDPRSRVENNVLHLVIIASKEKRGGCPVEKLCQIGAHSDPILCPVYTYTVYKEKVARNLCPTPHENNMSWTVNRLVRFISDSEKPLSVDSITRYIHSISALISNDPDAPIPKVRAIGATLAANSGASTLK
ncbi:hypothetical protein AYI68_g4364 [Smittium mucronatum]|uniref:Uncharacterized protein n=1 Tax=Smittium mucronatum TaxID=133383 RepID=A0A1R0GXB0_9FUNG|nr:hypothetical protein AYI68_g4364 [Smittium mucronatum]